VAQVYNKLDQITLEEVDRLAREPMTMVIRYFCAMAFARFILFTHVFRVRSTSCHWDMNLDRLIERIWSELRLVRIYTKKRGEWPDFETGVILRNGASVEHVVCKGPSLIVAANGFCV
jgi:ribosome-interacting GTPase 1